MNDKFSLVTEIWFLNVDGDMVSGRMHFRLDKIMRVSRIQLLVINDTLVSIYALHDISCFIGNCSTRNATTTSH